MTSKTHVALGLLTALVIQKYNPHLDTYTLISGVCIGSLMPDLDTQKSLPSQIFPPISWLVDKMTKHRGFTHTMFPLLLIIGYYSLPESFFKLMHFNRIVLLFLGIGAITHLAIDTITFALGMTCKSGWNNSLCILFWIGSMLIILSSVATEFNLFQYIPKDTLKTIKSYESFLVLNK